MGSSFGLVMRALVMLACLAVVPLVAMYGKYAPDFVQAVMEAYKSCTHAKAGADPREAGGDAPPFNASARTDAANGEKSAATPTPWNGQGPSARPLPESAGASATDDGGLKRATFNAPVGDRTADAQTRATNGTTLGNPTTSTSNAAEQNRAVAEGKASGDDCTTQFRRMEQRLRELGATYYLLETWGSSGDRYRFFCKMAISGTADYNRNRIFQATAADPLHAMQDVLEQVEQWRSGRQP
jgi:hypothetical protein